MISNAPSVQSHSATKASEKRNPITEALPHILALWPCVVGLAIARTDVITSSYGNYTSTDEGIFTDGSMLVALSVIAVLLLAIALRKTHIGKTTINRSARICFAFQFLTLVSLAGLVIFNNSSFMPRFLLSSLSVLVSTVAIYYWIRRVRGATAAIAAVFVFSSLILSEVLIYASSLFPQAGGLLFTGFISLLQFPCLIWARHQEQPYRLALDSGGQDFFGFAKAMISKKRYLIATAAGIGCFSLVIGLLRGFPDGTAIPFTTFTRVSYALLTILISALIIFVVLKKKSSIMVTGIWIIMYGLACLALVSYALFPANLEIGAVFTTTLNAIMVGFTLYITIAFMSHGWRDPYYYAFSGSLVWLGCRSIARILLLNFYPLTSNDVLMAVVMAVVLIISAEVVFVQFFNVSRQEQLVEEAPTPAKQGPLAKIMGLDDVENLTDMRQASMKQNAEEMGRQFLLSDREIEVLALYALGHTQKRVAEELFITPETTHARIKRIYAKTNLHSRQELIDYMTQYTS